MGHGVIIGIASFAWITVVTIVLLKILKNQHEQKIKDHFLWKGFDNYVDKQITLEKKIKEIDNILALIVNDWLPEREVKQ